MGSYSCSTTFRTTQTWRTVARHREESTSMTRGLVNSRGVSCRRSWRRPESCALVDDVSTISGPTCSVSKSEDVNGGGGFVLPFQCTEQSHTPSDS